jgi:hypothetical protein
MECTSLISPYLFSHGGQGAWEEGEGWEGQLLPPQSETLANR